MNAMFSPRSLRCLLLVLLGVGILPLFAASAFAAGSPADAGITMPILQANIIFELVSDRARLIQVSLVIVATGCALIWWYR
jgi:hypothetical protein